MPEPTLEIAVQRVDRSPESLAESSAGRADEGGDGAGLPLPQRMRRGDAAADLPAASACSLAPGERALVPTGFVVAIPAGFCGLVLPRSGLALEHGVTVLNAPGLIDPGYRGELKVILVNHGAETVHITRGQRIAQLLVVEVPSLAFVETAALPPAPDERGVDGFGSSG